MASLDPRITAYYERGEEAIRLGGGQPTGPLEFARTQELNVEVFNVEGPGVLLADIEERWSDPVHREVLLETARAVESDPALQAAGSHLLAAGTRPG